MQRKLAAILAADVVGYSRLAAPKAEADIEGYCPGPSAVGPPREFGAYERGYDIRQASSCGDWS